MRVCVRACDSDARARAHRSLRVRVRADGGMGGRTRKRVFVHSFVRCMDRYACSNSYRSATGTNPPDSSAVPIAVSSTANTPPEVASTPSTSSFVLHAGTPIAFKNGTELAGPYFDANIGVPAVGTCLMLHASPWHVPSCCLGCPTRTHACPGYHSIEGTRRVTSPPVLPNLATVS